MHRIFGYLQLRKLFLQDFIIIVYYNFNLFIIDKLTKSKTIKICYMNILFKCNGHEVNFYDNLDSFQNKI